VRLIDFNAGSRGFISASLFESILQLVAQSGKKLFEWGPKKRKLFGEEQGNEV